MTFLFISGGEIIIVVLVILLLFGADKIPEFAKTFGKGMQEFRKATEEIKREINQTTDTFTEEVDDVKESLNESVEDIHDTFNEATQEGYDPYGIEDQPYPTEGIDDDVVGSYDPVNDEVKTDSETETEIKPEKAEVQDAEEAPAKEVVTTKSKKGRKVKKAAVKAESASESEKEPVSGFPEDKDEKTAPEKETKE
jgi:TatA/E family protein of Tat protein translocase